MDRQRQTDRQTQTYRERQIEKDRQRRTHIQTYTFRQTQCTDKDRQKKYRHRQTDIDRKTQTDRLLYIFVFFSHKLSLRIWIVFQYGLNRLNLSGTLLKDGWLIWSSSARHC